MLSQGEGTMESSSVEVIGAAAWAGRIANVETVMAIRRKTDKMRFMAVLLLGMFQRIHARIVTNCNHFVNTFQRDSRGNSEFF